MKKEKIDISNNRLIPIMETDGGLTPLQFQEFIIEYLLGKDYYVSGPCGGDQARLMILVDILEKYSKRYRQEQAKYKKVKTKVLDAFTEYIYTLKKTRADGIKEFEQLVRGK